MFRHSLQRLRAWLEAPEDVLGASPAPVQPASVELYLTHPHRRPLRWDRERRPGMVPAKPAHCLSPVRSSGTGRERHRRVQPQG
jgi:hypothetical protein